MTEKRSDPFSRPVDFNYSKPSRGSTEGLQPEILDILPTVEAVFREIADDPDYQITITAGQEWDPHHGIWSLHHTGYAVDIRTRDLPGGPDGDMARLILARLKKKLGSRYFLQLEQPPHIHIQFNAGVRASWPGDFPQRGVPFG